MKRILLFVSISFVYSSVLYAMVPGFASAMPSAAASGKSRYGQKPTQVSRIPKIPKLQLSNQTRDDIALVAGLEGQPRVGMYQYPKKVVDSELPVVLTRLKKEALQVVSDENFDIAKKAIKDRNLSDFAQISNQLSDRDLVKLIDFARHELVSKVVENSGLKSSDEKLLLKFTLDSAIKSKVAKLRIGSGLFKRTGISLMPHRDKGFKDDITTAQAEQILNVPNKYNREHVIFNYRLLANKWDPKLEANKGNSQALKMYAKLSKAFNHLIDQFKVHGEGYRIRVQDPLRFQGDSEKDVYRVHDELARRELELTKILLKKAKKQDFGNNDHRANSFSNAKKNFVIERVANILCIAVMVGVMKYYHKKEIEELKVQNVQYEEKDVVRISQSVWDDISKAFADTSLSEVFVDSIPYIIVYTICEVVIRVLSRFV